MNAKIAKASVDTIAKCTGLKVSTVRRHRREGKLNMDNFTMVAEYVVGWRMVNKIEEQE